MIFITRRVIELTHTRVNRLKPPILRHNQPDLDFHSWLAGFCVFFGRQSFSRESEAQWTVCGFTIWRQIDFQARFFNKFSPLHGPLFQRKIFEINLHISHINFVPRWSHGDRSNYEVLKRRSCNWNKVHSSQGCKSISKIHTYSENNLRSLFLCACFGLSTSSDWSCFYFDRLLGNLILVNIC